jgi:hypothetical protein
VNWGPLGAAESAGAAAAPAPSPEVDAPPPSGPQLRINPIRNSRPKMPTYGDDGEQPIE